MEALEASVEAVDAVEAAGGRIDGDLNSFSTGWGWWSRSQTLVGLTWIWTVADVLDRVHNILLAAEKLAETGIREIQVTEIIEECGSLYKIKELQSHENEGLYKKALHIIINAHFG